MKDILKKILRVLTIAASGLTGLNETASRLAYPKDTSLPSGGPSSGSTAPYPTLRFGAGLFLKQNIDLIDLFGRGRRRLIAVFEGSLAGAVSVCLSWGDMSPRRTPPPLGLRASSLIENKFSKFLLNFISRWVNNCIFIIKNTLFINCTEYDSSIIS